MTVAFKNEEEFTREEARKRTLQDVEAREQRQRGLQVEQCTLGMSSSPCGKSIRCIDGREQKVRM